MKLAFFVSSIGDADLAFGTIKTLEKQGHEIILVALTKAIQDKVNAFSSSLPIKKTTLAALVNITESQINEGDCTEKQLTTISAFIAQEQINYAFIGVPSVMSNIPFQIAKLISNIPVLMAYEFMFKPEKHAIWQHTADLNAKANLRWAVPLPAAIDDFGKKARIDIIGHMSIDNAFLPKPISNMERIRESLEIANTQSLTFISSTTQPITTDSAFLESLLRELPNHPSIQLRFGIHPGIQDLDTYLMEVASIYHKYNKPSQFKIIFPGNLIGRIKKPAESIENPQYNSLFLKVNITGAEAANAADRVAQAVPGALLNTAALEGKPVYSHFLGKPYLPRDYFSTDLSHFFRTKSTLAHTKEELGLNKQLATERLAELINYKKTAFIKLLDPLIKKEFVLQSPAYIARHNIVTRLNNAADVFFAQPATVNSYNVFVAEWQSLLQTESKALAEHRRLFGAVFVALKNFFVALKRAIFNEVHRSSFFSTKTHSIEIMDRIDSAVSKLNPSN